MSEVEALDFSQKRNVFSAPRLPPRFVAPQWRPGSSVSIALEHNSIIFHYNSQRCDAQTDHLRDCPDPVLLTQLMSLSRVQPNMVGPWLCLPFPFSTW